MASLRFRGRGQRQKTLLLVALGALTGIAVAVALSDRGKRRRRRSAASLDAAEREERPAAISRGDSTDEPPVVDDAFEGDDEDDELPDPSAAPMAPGDEELEDRVLEAFHNDPTLRGRAIDIGAIGDGIIELTGWVHSAAEVGYAITLARGVPDVAHVMDSLTIRTPEHARTRKPSADH